MERIEKYEKFGILILLAMLVGLGINKYFVERKIDENPVFVIGHLKKVTSPGAEGGWVFDFEYNYNNQQYYTSIGSANESTLKDSLMYFMISVEKPHFSKPVMGQWVPPCVVKEGQPLLGWKKIPYCK